MKTTGYRKQSEEGNMAMNHCTNCGATIADDDLIIWKCSECGKKYKIKISKIRKMQLLKDKPENAGKFILKCRECGIEMDTGNEKMFYKCKKCGEVLKGNLEYFASEDVEDDLAEDDYSEIITEHSENHEEVLNNKK